MKTQSKILNAVTEYLDKGATTITILKNGGWIVESNLPGQGCATWESFVNGGYDLKYFPNNSEGCWHSEQEPTL